MNKQLISLEDRMVRVKGNLVSDMDGDKVMMSIENGKYYNLGPVGGRIWDLLETPASVNEVVITLTQEYDVERAKCEEQVLSFLELLYKEQLIQGTDS